MCTILLKQFNNVCTTPLPNKQVTDPESFFSVESITSQDDEVFLTNIIITESLIIDSIKELSSKSVIIKVFERVIRKQIVTFLISNEHLNPNQHGFRGRRSLHSVLLSVFDDVMQLLRSGNNTVDMVYIDFAKAFNKVDHGVLLQKIKMLGITGKLGVWLYHFLTDRTQFVMLQ